MYFLSKSEIKEKLAKKHAQFLLNSKKTFRNVSFCKILKKKIQAHGYRAN